MNSGITINGVALATYGATLLNGGFAELLMPAAKKEYITNDSPLKNGVEMASFAPKIKDREVTLTFVIEGKTQADFLTKKKNFLAEIMDDEVVLYVPALGEYYHLYYLSCTSYDNHRLKGCKLAIKFKEPNPTNRVQ